MKLNYQPVRFSVLHKVWNTTKDSTLAKVQHDTYPDKSLWHDVLDGIKYSVETNLDNPYWDLRHYLLEDLGIFEEGA